MNTKENPGCYHDMLRYLSKLSGIEVNETVQLAYNQVFKSNNKGNRICNFPAHKVNFVINGKPCGFLHKQMRKGNIPVLTDGVTDYPYDVDIDYFIVEKQRKLDDFGIKYEKVGKYKDSLGGGWYSNVDLYQVNDQYFAMMECTC